MSAKLKLDAQLRGMRDNVAEARRALSNDNLSSFLTELEALAASLRWGEIYAGQWAQERKGKKI